MTPTHLLQKATPSSKSQEVGFEHKPNMKTMRISLKLGAASVSVALLMPAQ